MEARTTEAGSVWPVASSRATRLRAVEALVKVTASGTFSGSAKRAATSASDACGTRLLVCCGDRDTSSRSRKRGTQCRWSLLCEHQKNVRGGNFAEHGLDDGLGERFAGKCGWKEVGVEADPINRARCRRADHGDTARRSRNPQKMRALLEGLDRVGAGEGDQIEAGEVGQRGIERRK